jgi:hypothetical protein
VLYVGKRIEVKWNGQEIFLSLDLDHDVISTFITLLKIPFHLHVQIYFPRDNNNIHLYIYVLNILLPQLRKEMMVFNTCV